jgi:anti-sigma regulatory factor (Ser/Thr protein kinase)
VTEPNSARVATSRFTAHPTSPSAARRFVAETVEKFGCDRHAHLAVLMANELVTNAVVHAGTPVTVVVQADDEGVRVEVHDQNPRPPLRRIAFGEDEAGRGLAVVESLSTRWGVDALEGGKSVWFELAG